MAIFSKEELEQFKSSMSSGTGGAVRRNQQKMNEKPKKKPQGGLAGFATSLLGEAGGAGGALGGAALGTAIAPGIGTLIGAGLGGFLGGTGGQVAENVVRDDEVNLGKALKTGAVEGVFGAGPLRIGKALAGAAKATRTGENVAEAASRASQTPLLSKLPGAKKLGTSLSVGASGLKPSKEVGALENVDKTAQALAGMGIKGTPKKQASQIGEELSRLGGEVDAVLAQTPGKLQGNSIVQRLTGKNATLDDRFLDLDLLDGTVQKNISQLGAKFAGAKTAKEVNDVVKTLNKSATRAEDKLRNPNAAPLTAKETAVLALKRSADDALGEVTEIKPLKQQMATLYGANPDIVAASQRAVGLPMASGVSAKAPNQAVRGIASRAGANLQGAPQEMTNRGILGRSLAAGAVNMSNEPTEEAPLPPGEGLPDATLAGSTGLEDPLAQMDSGYGSVFSDPAQVEALYLQALNLGDTQTANAIIKGYELFGQAGGGQKPLSAEASKVLANANSGLQSLSQLEGIIGQSGGVPKSTLVPGRGIFGNLGANALGTAEYDNAARNIADVITRLRTGAALTESEERFYKSQLPQAFDSPEAIQQKLGMFRDLFASVSNRTGTAGSDLQQSVGL